MSVDDDVCPSKPNFAPPYSHLTPLSSFGKPLLLLLLPLDLTLFSSFFFIALPRFFTSVHFLSSIMGVTEVLSRKSGVIVGDDVLRLFEYAQANNFAVPAIVCIPSVYPSMDASNGSRVSTESTGTWSNLELSLEQTPLDRH